MDQETVDYIINYFSHFLHPNEVAAIRHETSILKVGDDEKLFQMHFKRGWITNESEVLNLLKNGFDEFRKRTAERIILENGDLIFLNKCPKCSRLTRTPNAKQCRYCNFNWHD